MADGPKIQGEVSLSSERAEAALNRVADVGDKMASRLNTSAQKAGDAVDGIGSGANKSAEEFSRAEGRIAQSIQRTTSSMQLLGKTASEKFEFKIADKGLDISRFAPYLAQLRAVESAQGKLNAGGQAMASTYGGGLTRNIQNTAFQLQDYVVQVNGGVDSTKALAMQLPQMLVGFGALGAGIGVLAALLPNIAQAFGLTSAKSKTLAESMSDLDGAIGETGSTVKAFDMDGLYEQFNKANQATRQAIVEQLDFQRVFIETSRLTSGKKFAESLDGLGSYGLLDKMAGSFGSDGAQRLQKQLEIPLETAKDLLPVLSGLRAGTQDVSLAFNRFGISLLGGNQSARDLAKQMGELSRSERDAAAASSAISEAQAKMAKGHVQTKKELAEAEKAAKDSRKGTESAEATAYASAMDKLAKVQGEAGASALDLNRSQRTLFDLMTSAEWANMPESWRLTAVEQFESANAVERVAEAQKRLNQLMGQTDSGKLAAARADMQLLADAFERGAISEAEYVEAATTQLDKLTEKVKDVKGIETVISNAFSNLGDAVADFALKGTGSFGKMVEAMISDLIRLQIQTAATTIFKEAGGMSGIAKWIGSFFSPSSSAAPVANALGGVYQSPSLSNFSSGVYHTPQVFAFAKGAGVFAEAGPEAIMPLERRSDGRLGVLSDSAAAGVTVNVYNSGGDQSRVNQRSDGKGGSVIDIFIEQVKGSLAGDIASGSGAVPAAMQQTYGLSRRPGAY